MTLAPLAPPQPNVATGGVIPTDIVCFTPTGAGTMDGTSWANAMAGTQTNIQSAIDNASTTGRNRLLFWEGEYTNYLTLVNTVSLIGGFSADVYDCINGIDAAHESIFKFDSTSTTTRQISVSTGDCYLHNIVFTGTGLGVTGTSVHKINLQSCYIRGKLLNKDLFDGDGQALRYVNAINCYIYGNYQTLGRSLIAYSNLTSCKIYGNRTNMPYSPMIQNYTNLTNCRIYGNYIYGTNNACLSSKGVKYYNCVIYNNYLSRGGSGDVASLNAEGYAYNCMYANNGASHLNYIFGAWTTTYYYNCLFVFSSAYKNTTSNVFIAYNSISNTTKFNGTKYNCFFNINVEMSYFCVNQSTDTLPTSLNTGATAIDIMATPETCTDEYWLSLHKADWRLKSNTATAGGQSLVIGVRQDSCLVDADGIDRQNPTSVGAYVAPSEKI